MTMTDRQYYADCWLSRTDDHDGEIKQLKIRKDSIIESMSGVGKYDDKAVHGGSDSNPTEAKNIEYSLICERIERLERKVAIENARTMEVIDKVKDSKLRGMMIARYINHFSWRKVGELYHYAKSSSYNYRAECLNAVAPFVPKEAFIPDNKFKSLKVCTKLD